MPVIGLPDLELGSPFPIVPKISTRILTLEKAIAAHLEWKRTVTQLVQFLLRAVAQFNDPEELFEHVERFLEFGQTSFDFLAVGRPRPTHYVFQDDIERRMRSKLLRQDKARKHGLFVPGVRKTRASKRNFVYQRVPHR